MHNCFKILKTLNTSMPYASAHATVVSMILSTSVSIAINQNVTTGLDQNNSHRSQRERERLYIHMNGTEYVMAISSEDVNL